MPPVALTRIQARAAAQIVAIRSRAEAAARTPAGDAPCHLSASTGCVNDGASSESPPPPPAQHADPRGDGARAVDRPRHSVDALEVARVRQTLADHARLQSDHRASVGEGRLDLCADTDPGGHDGTAGHTDALAATLAPVRQASRSASPGSIQRERGEQDPVEGVAPPVGSRSSTTSDAASYTVRHTSTAPSAPRFTHAADSARRAGVRRRPGPPRSATRLTFVAMTTVAPAVSSSILGSDGFDQGHDAASPHPLRS